MLLLHTRNCVTQDAKATLSYLMWKKNENKLRQCCVKLSKWQYTTLLDIQDAFYIVPTPALSPCWVLAESDGQVGVGGLVHVKHCSFQVTKY